MSGCRIKPRDGRWSHFGLGIDMRVEGVFMKVIGLTGGIASGKSTVSSIIQGKCRIPVIDADVLARAVVEPGTPGLAQIAETFGREVLTDKDELDRKVLGKLIREDDEKRLALNAITHPLINDLYQQKLSAYRNQGETLVVYDAPLLLEGEGIEGVDMVIVVVTDEKERIARLMSRDDSDEATARAKLTMQMSDAERIERSDVVIYNNGGFQDLTDAVIDLFTQLKNGVFMSEDV